MKHCSKQNYIKTNHKTLVFFCQNFTKHFRLGITELQYPLTCMHQTQAHTAHAEQHIQNRVQEIQRNGLCCYFEEFNCECIYKERNITLMGDKCVLVCKKMHICFQVNSIFFSLDVTISNCSLSKFRFNVGFGEFPKSHFIFVWLMCCAYKGGNFKL